MYSSCKSGLHAELMRLPVQVYLAVHTTHKHVDLLWCGKVKASAVAYKQLAHIMPHYGHNAVIGGNTVHMISPQVLSIAMAP